MGDHLIFDSWRWGETHEILIDCGKDKSKAKGSPKHV